MIVTYYGESVNDINVVTCLMLKAERTSWKIVLAVVGNTVRGKMDYCKRVKTKFLRDEIEEVRMVAVLGLYSFAKEGRTVFKEESHTLEINVLCLKAGAVREQSEHTKEFHR